MSHLCKVKIVWVRLLASQPHWDEDDDGSVWQGWSRRWLVVLWWGGVFTSPRRGLPWFRCCVAIDDICAVHCRGSMKQRSDEGLLPVICLLLLWAHQAITPLYLCFPPQNNFFQWFSAKLHESVQDREFVASSKMYLSLKVIYFRSHWAHQVSSNTVLTKICILVLFVSLT